jgi:TolA-binding protein
MSFGFDRDPGGLGSGPPLPPGWLPWLQLGLTTMLGVLFVVTLLRARDLSLDLQQMERRLQSVESRQALDRSTVLEQQLRSMLERLQALEGKAERLNALEGERERLEQELTDLRSRTSGRPSAQDASPAPGPPPTPPSGSAPPLRPVPSPGPTGGGSSVIRPPAQGSF